MMKGYLKLHRQMVDNPIVYKDADHLAIWIDLLIHAQFQPCEVTFGGEKITLRPGQLITGRKKIADRLRVTESKVQRVLKCFEIEHQIEQRTNNQCRLITIVAWDRYQLGEQQTAQQVNNKRTTSEQRMNTIQEYKNIRNKESLLLSMDKGDEQSPDGVGYGEHYVDPVTGRIRVNMRR